MIETNYDYNSGYHQGSLVEQDARAFLGVYKSVEDVPARHYLSNFRTDVDANEAWRKFCSDELSNTSQHTRETVYGRAYELWCEYCEKHDVHPALADPDDIEGWLTEQVAASDASLKTTHDTRFRPLFKWYRWMAFNPDWPHRYQPTIMAVLLGGATYDIWQTRLWDRKNIPQENE
ncbi:hypothetical protein [Haloarchaeobius sp. HME9146]|uniref:hypothetical protein n=1 Tax=Haloarchaeobius sp. HME9146 TaxID=2978732 RepID=UPI0021C0EA0A|nr:hypothetical protein [Haloarchaeobius sp. HME9146]MCT9096957.1 hypothetical protein [Haloarchaeobius sp. HME9146]